MNKKSNTPRTDAAFSAYNPKTVGFAYLRKKMAELEEELVNAQRRLDDAMTNRYTPCRSCRVAFFLS